jgi:transcriptional regulator with XRE-family HTH domain
MSQGWERLGAAVVARRVELGMLTREQLVEKSGMSRRLLSDIENGRRTSYDPATLARVEQALQWLPGTVDRILAEGDAQAGDVGDADPLLRELGAMLADDSPIPPTTGRRCGRSWTAWWRRTGRRCDGGAPADDYRRSSTRCRTCSAPKYPTTNPAAISVSNGRQEKTLT